MKKSSPFRTTCARESSKFRGCVKPFSFFSDSPVIERALKEFLINIVSCSLISTKYFVRRGLGGCSYQFHKMLHFSRKRPFCDAIQVGIHLNRRSFSKNGYDRRGAAPKGLGALADKSAAKMKLNNELQAKMRERVKHMNMKGKHHMPFKPLPDKFKSSFKPPLPSKKRPLLDSLQQTTPSTARTRILEQVEEPVPPPSQTKLQSKAETINKMSISELQAVPQSQTIAPSNEHPTNVTVDKVNVRVLRDKELYKKDKTLTNLQKKKLELNMRSKMTLYKNITYNRNTLKIPTFKKREVKMDPYFSLELFQTKTNFTFHHILTAFCKVVNKEEILFNPKVEIPNEYVDLLYKEVKDITGFKRVRGVILNTLVKGLIIDFDTGDLIVDDANVTFRLVERKVIQNEEDLNFEAFTKDKKIDKILVGDRRSPIVTVMGHVDHGKTTLLDTFRQASVASREAGGITQNLSAFRVNLSDIAQTTQANDETDESSIKSVVFLDTPGHEAFTSMRSCGVSITDIALIVISANDGIQPQTIESIRLAKDHGASIVIVVTKIDQISSSYKDPADVSVQSALTLLSNSLLEFDIETEILGGDTQMIPISSLNNYGLDNLLECLLLQSEVLNLGLQTEQEQQEQVGNSKTLGEAVVLESTSDRHLGKVIDCIVTKGEIKRGDVYLVGTESSKIRSILIPQYKNDTSSSSESKHSKAEQIKVARVCDPIRIIGVQLDIKAGSKLEIVSNLRQAKEIGRLREKLSYDEEVESKPTEILDPKTIKRVNNLTEKKLKKILLGEKKAKFSKESIESLRHRYIERLIILKQKAQSEAYNEEIKQLTDKGIDNDDNNEHKTKLLLYSKATLDDFLEYNFEKVDPIVLNIVLKADTYGSLEALRFGIEQINSKLNEKANTHLKQIKKLKEKIQSKTSKTNEVEILGEIQQLQQVLPLNSKLEVIKSDVGQISNQDLVFNDSYVFGFNVAEVKHDEKTTAANIQIYVDEVIYKLFDNANKLLDNYLPKPLTMKVNGRAEVLEVYEMNPVKKVSWTVAGCRIKDGVLDKKNEVRVIRNKNILFQGQLKNLNINKNSVKEVKTDQMCGIHIDKYQDFQVGDIIESISYASDVK